VISSRLEVAKPGAVSVDLRERVVGVYKRKEGSIRGLARRFGVSPKSVERWLQLKAETGSLEPSRAVLATPSIHERSCAFTSAFVRSMSTTHDPHAADRKPRPHDGQR
jgi:hypothetical protein